MKRHAKKGSAARRRFPNIREKPCAVVKMTPTHTRTHEGEGKLTSVDTPTHGWMVYRRCICLDTSKGKAIKLAE